MNRRRIWSVVEYLLADEGPGDGGAAVIPGAIRRTCHAHSP